jgi:hypothetical protein
LRFEPDHFAVTRDESDRAGDAFLVDVLLDFGGDALEALGGKADGLGLGGGKLLGRCGKTGKKQTDNQERSESIHHCDFNSHLNLEGLNQKRATAGLYNGTPA